MDETKLLLSKIADLGRLCEKNSYPAFSKFLDSSSLAMASGVRSPDGTYIAWGGYAEAERKVMGCFPPEYAGDGALELFPVCTLKLLASAPHELTHRDYLGALMGLGIQRECLGDIVLFEKGAYVLCIEDIVPFILANLDKIGRVSVKVEQGLADNIPAPTLVRKSATVASNRIDCVVAQVRGCSRTQVEELIRMGKIQINYLQTDSPSKKLKSGDTVSVRGFGKFIYVGDSGETKKGRLKIEYDLYN